MSVVLGIDTSSSDLSVGIVSNGYPLASFTRYVKNSHAEHIANIVETLLKTAGVTPKEITHTAISKGPGSFTGLRIGAAFLKGLIIGSNVKVMEISSLQLLADAVTTRDCKITAVIDARQGNIFTADFIKKGYKTVRLSDDILTGSDSLKEITLDSDIVILDSLGNINFSISEFIQKNSLISTANIKFQRGLNAAIIADENIENRKFWKSANEIKPNYMQNSYVANKR